MKAKLTIGLMLLLTAIYSCNLKGKDKTTQNSTITELKREPNQKLLPETDDKKIPTGSMETEVSDSVPNQTPPAKFVKNNPNPQWDKKIIKTATLNFQVKDFKNFNKDVHNSVNKFEGYIAEEEQNSSKEKLETSITIKVPVEEFESLMNQLPNGDVKVLERKITTEDVTGQVVDTKARLEAKKQMRLKYLEFLKQSKNMEEVLQVQNEINSITEEIEAAASRIGFLSNQSNYSTINLTFFQPMPGFTPIDGSPTFVSKIVDSFKIGLSWIGTLLVGLVALWPLILILIVGYFIRKRIIATKKIIAVKVQN